MKTLVIAVPKSGTYLMRELLEGMGQGESHLHVGPVGLYDYSKISYEEGRKSPASCLSRMPLKESFSKINNYAMSHLIYSDEVKDMLSGFTLLLLTRDIREIILSGMVWCLSTGRRDGEWKNGTKEEQLKQWIKIYGDHIAMEYKNIMKWKPYAHCFDYSELKAGSERLANIYGYDGIKDLTQTVLNTPTLTKMSTYSKDDYWDVESEQMATEIINKHGITYGCA